MTLPVSRDKTFAAGTKIPSAVLNNLQDFLISHDASIVALENLLYADKEKDVPLTLLDGTTGLSGSFVGTLVSDENVGPVHRAHYDIGSNPEASVWGVLPMESGETLKSVRLKCYGGSGNNLLEFRVYKRDLTGTGSKDQIGATQTTVNDSTSVQTLEVSGLSEAYSSSNQFYGEATMIPYDGTTLPLASAIAMKYTYGVV